MAIVTTEAQKAQIRATWGEKVTSIISGVKNSINKTTSSMLAYGGTFDTILAEMTAAGCTQAQIDEATQIKADLVSVYNILITIDI